MPNANCPGADELRDFLVGRLEAAELEKVAGHLETCGECSTVVDRLDDSHDDLVRELRRPIPDEPERERQFQRITELVERIGTAEIHRFALASERETINRSESKSESKAAVDAALQKSSPAQLGQYDLLEKLGEGAMGQVYRARHRLMNREAAIKIMHPRWLDRPDALIRFQREIRALAQLQHPNIVRAEYADREGDMHYLVMEFIEGVNLSHLVRKRGPLPVSQACAVIVKAAAGLQHAFERGLVHRDLKPSNLILTPGGEVKILDLGLARCRDDVAAEEATAAGAVLGTFDYMAPEQGDDAHQVDIRADIYSLGCTLYFLLAGRAPFERPEFGSALKKLRAHAAVPPPPLQQQRPDVPDALAGVLERLLAKEPSDRPTTPAEVMALLRPFAEESALEGLGDMPRPTLTQDAVGTVSYTPSTLPATPRKITLRSRRAGLRWALVAGAIVVILTAVWPQRCTPEKTDLPKTVKPIIVPVGITAFDIKHYRGDPPVHLGTLGVLSPAAREDDDVRVHVQLDSPAFCYLIAYNPDGKEQPCSPKNPDAIPDAVSELLYPETTYYGLTDGAGTQAFVLLAAREPLPSFAEWKKVHGHGKAPWQSIQEEGVWRFDGREFTLVARERGQERQRNGPPQALQHLADFFKDRAGNATVRIVSFPVQKKN